MSVPPPTWISPALPLIGLAGIIVNTTPPLTPDLPVTTNPPGSCFYGSFGGGTCPTIQNNNCPTCPQVTNNPPCTCEIFCNSPLGCTQTWLYRCTSQCQQLNTALTCPNGTYVPPFIKNGNSVAGTCSYIPSASNLNWFVSQSRFPSSFITSMIQRYAVSLYIDKWNTELYEDADGKSWFHRITDYTNPGQEAIFRDHLNSEALVNLPPVIPSFDQFTIMLQNAVMYPQMLYSSTGAFSMLFYVYGSPFSVNPSSINISTYLQSFTMERPAQVQNLAPLLGTPVNNPQFAPAAANGYPPDLTTNKYYIFVDLTTYRVYNIGVPETQLQSIQQVRTGLPNNDFYIIGRVYSVPIVKLSPILTYIFSQTYPNLPFDSLGAGGLCDKVLSDTTQVPGICFTNTCNTSAFSAQCKSIMSTYCQISSIPNSFPGMSSAIGGVNNFFLNSTSSQCRCFNTQLPPPINRVNNLQVGMCFTNACTSNPALMNEFGLTDQYCSQYCGEVSDWLNNPDPTKRSALPQALDAGQYQRLCGSYSPSSSKVNPVILGGGTGFAFIIGLVAFLISSNIWLGMGLFLGILALGIYLSFDLKGVPYCTPTGSACQSSISHVEIPNLFCSYWLGCECGLGKACPSGNTCIAGICIPQSTSPPSPPPPPPPSQAPTPPENLRWLVS